VYSTCVVHKLYGEHDDILWKLDFQLFVLRVVVGCNTVSHNPQHIQPKIIPTVYHYVLIQSCTKYKIPKLYTNSKVRCKNDILKWQHQKNHLQYKYEHHITIHHNQHITCTHFMYCIEYEVFCIMNSVNDQLHKWQHNSLAITYFEIESMPLFTQVIFRNFLIHLKIFNMITYFIC
jgi:hypothetical protein